MPDHATSSDTAVQAQLDRLWALSPGADILGLERITHLLARLGDPQHRLPPVFHVAGTNGKGSTCAFLRAALEAAGLTTHVYSSPHLVRFNERIRLAGTLIDDAALAVLLSDVLDQAADLTASFFEVTTAAAFLAFARTPADACIVEVGLGGRLDATNVLRTPAVCGIAALGIDHQAFLGDTLPAIAAEKAGIAKRGVPLVTMRYPPDIDGIVAAVAQGADATVYPEGSTWNHEADAETVRYRDAHGTIEAPLPTLVGAHQAENWALAAAMLRHQQAVPVPDGAIVAAATTVRWPARMQRLRGGPLLDRLPAGSTIHVDGAHNPSAAGPVARAFVSLATHPRHLIVGMLANKDAGEVLALLAPGLASIHTVPVANHGHHAPAALADQARAFGIPAQAHATIEDALTAIAAAGTPVAVLIAGSLYLAGTVLSSNDEPPD